MKQQHAWCALALAAMTAIPAQGVEFFMPIPNLGANYQWETEFLRQDLSKDKVSFTFVAEGQSASDCRRRTSECCLGRPRTASIRC